VSESRRIVPSARRLRFDSWFEGLPLLLVPGALSELSELLERLRLRLGAGVGIVGPVVVPETPETPEGLCWGAKWAEI
jgi:hypothetical protein